MAVVCCCSLAGTAACRTCSNNPFAETPPPVRTYTVSATDPVLIIGQKTNADRIRAMTDEELAELWWERVDCGECPVHKECKLTWQDCKRLALDWLKQEVSTNG